MSGPDALVVGAGPAGCVAALLLARAGIRVHLYDRARFPRHKLCGDTLNPGSLAIVDALDDETRPGGPVATGDLGSRVRRRSIPISGMVVTGPDGTTVAADYPDSVHGVALTRAALDRILVETAVEAGVRFEEAVPVLGPVTSGPGERVSGIRIALPAGEHVLRARMVVAADGRASKLASALGLSGFAARPRRWASGAYFTDVAGMSSRGEMHIRRGGYVGVAPLPGGLVNVCIVREPKRGRLDRPTPSQAVFQALLADPLLRERFADARQVSDVVTLGPLAVESRGSGRPGLLLAGDAAGFVDPMTGDGLRFALRGGALAAAAAIDELTSGVPAYISLHEARAREFAAKWRINRALRALVGSPGSVRAAAVVARCWPAPVRYLVSVAGDVALASAVARPSSPAARQVSS